jgi:hypothetical protein
MFFEYAYAKIVSRLVGKLIFTDQSDPSNCGYKKVDFIRKYILKNNNQILTIYVKDENMIKLLDFDNFNITDNDPNFYFDDVDIINNEPLKTFYDIKSTIEPKNKVEIKGNLLELQENNSLIKKTIDIEKWNSIQFMIKLRQAFYMKNQIKLFFDIVKQTVPSDYHNPSSKASPIEEYYFDLSSF